MHGETDRFRLAVLSKTNALEITGLFVRKVVFIPSAPLLWNPQKAHVGSKLELKACTHEEAT